MNEQTNKQGVELMTNEAIWGCRHCGDTYEGSLVKGLNDKCSHCGLLQSKSYEEQINNSSSQYDQTLQ